MSPKAAKSRAIDRLNRAREKSKSSLSAAESAMRDLQTAVLEGFELHPGEDFEIGGLLLGTATATSVQVDAIQPLNIEHRFGPSFWLSPVDLERWKKAIRQVDGGVQGNVIGHFRSVHLQGTKPDQPDVQDVDHAIADLLPIGDPVVLLAPISGNALAEALVFRRLDGIWQQLLRNPMEAVLGTVGAKPGPIPAEAVAPEVEEDRGPGTAALLGTAFWKRRWLAGAAALVLAGGVLIYETAGRRTATPTGGTLIGLTAHRATGGIAVQWNRESPVVRGSSSGVLTIRDGEKRTQLDLNRDQLLDGSAVYVPATGQVDFRLEVYQDTSHYTGESITVATGIRAGAAPAAQVEAVAPSSSKPANPPGSARVVMERPHLSEGDATRASAPPRATVPFTEPPARTAENEFVSPPAPQIPITQAPALRTGSPDVLKALSGPMPQLPAPAGAARPNNSTELPKVAPVTSAQPPFTQAPRPAATPPTVQGSPAAPPAGTPQTVQGSPATPPAGATGVNGAASAQQPTSYVGPKPVRKVNPTIPENMRALVQQTTAQKFSVDVKIQIDAAGNVVSATAPPGATPAQKLLGTRAVEAARQWHFEPARKNGQNVSSEDVLTFVFERH